MSLDKLTPQSYIPYIATGTGIFAGIGSPEGVQAGGIGSEYTDLVTGAKYTKTTVFDTLTGWSAFTGGGGPGLTSVGLTGNALFNISNSPLIANGNINLDFATQTANKVFASPASGAAAIPTFRALVPMDIPAGAAIADPPNFSLQYNNGSNVLEGDAGLTFDPITTSLLLGASGLTGNLFLRNTNGFALKFLTNNPVTQNITLPDALPSSTNRMLGVTALSGSNWTVGYFTPSSILDAISSTQGSILYRDSSSWLALAPGTSGNLLQTNGAAANPTWVTPPSGASGANPSALVGVTTVNGVAATFMRSDAAPALSQAIAPTWTGQHIHQLSNAAAVSIGANGDTNPVLRIVTNVASAATGISVTGNAAGGGVALAVLSSAGNEALAINAKGTGRINVAGGNWFFQSTGFVGVNNGIGISGATGGIVFSEGGTQPSRFHNGAFGSLGTGVGQVQIASSGITQRGNLHVEPSANTLPALWLSFASATGSDSPIAAFRRSRGTNASPAAVQGGDILARIIGYGQFNTADANFTSGGEIRVVSKETWSNSQNGAQMEFYTAPLGGGAAAQVGKFHASGVWCVSANPTTVSSVNKQVVGNSGGFQTDVISCVATGNVDTTTSGQDLMLGASSTSYFDRLFELGDSQVRGRRNINGQTETQVGRSATYARGVGHWQSNITPTANSGSTETTLHSYTITGTSLRQDKDCIRLQGSGHVASNANNKQLRFKFGATTFGDSTAVPQTGGSFTFTARIVRTGATAQTCYIELNNATGGTTGLLVFTNSTTAAETLSGNVTLAITGQGAASSDITLDYSAIEYLPATI